MSRTVFILGAGASREAGAPLMGDFLDIADALRKTGKVGSNAESFDLVFKAVAALQAVHSKSSLDLDNMESLFAAFEMAALFNRPLGPLSIERVQELPAAMRCLIVQTLEQQIIYPVHDRRALPPEPYSPFVELLSKLWEKDAGKVAIITFNYDLALDYALHFSSVPLDYCLEDKASSSPVHLMKLHGSLNWTRCTQCPAITPWPLEQFFSQHRWQFWPGDKGPARLDLAAKLPSGLIHCNKPRSSEPAIVPPTWNKTQHHLQISNVWRHAARHLSEAENIFVVGYSLPDTDQFFRYLFALGTVGDTLIKRFWVFDPDESVRRRYDELLGQIAKKRFQYHRLDFRNAISVLGQTARSGAI
jgi:hypothetical protein